MKNRIGIKSSEENPKTDIEEGELRYRYLDRTISGLEPREHFSIIEVGVWKGDRAVRMGYAACQIADTVSYTGYDLFEDITEDIITKEFVNKDIISLEKATSRLNWFIEEFSSKEDFSFNLIKGDTNITLKDKSILADFVFIDGGHSSSTIKNDYAAFKECPLVVLDDYYIGFDDNVVDKIGSNSTVDLIKEDPNYSVAFISGPHDVMNINGVDGKIALAVVRRTNV